MMSICINRAIECYPNTELKRVWVNNKLQLTVSKEYALISLSLASEQTLWQFFKCTNCKNIFTPTLALHNVDWCSLVCFHSTACSSWHFVVAETVLILSKHEEQSATFANILSVTATCCHMSFGWCQVVIFSLEAVVRRASVFTDFHIPDDGSVTRSLSVSTNGRPYPSFSSRFRQMMTAGTRHVFGVGRIDHGSLLRRISPSLLWLRVPRTLTDGNAVMTSGYLIDTSHLSEELFKHVSTMPLWSRLCSVSILALVLRRWLICQPWETEHFPVAAGRISGRVW